MNVHILWYCTASELDEVLALRKNVGVYNSDEDTLPILQKVISYDPEAICVIRQGGKVVWSCMIIYHPFQTFVYRFGIHTEYQNLGLWTELSKFIDETLRAKWMLHPTLFVEEGNDIWSKFWSTQWREKLYKVDCFVKNLEK